jgi:hypothetical protein
LSVSLSGPAESQVALDNSGGPLNGDIYSASYFTPVKIFSSDGTSLGSLTGIPEACGVAVDQTDGSVYVGDYGSKVWRFTPNSPTVPLSNADFTRTGITTTGIEPCQVAADGAGHVYASNWSDGPLKRYDVTSFDVSNPGQSGVLTDTHGNAMATDPQSHDIYVDEGNKISVFDSKGALVTTIGSGDISGSRGVAVSVVPGASHGFVYAANANHVAEFGFVPGPYAPIENRAVVHGVRQARVHSYGDFQVTPDGRFGAFSSTLPLTGYDNADFSEVFRYDTQGDALECVSCNPTNARAEGGSALTTNGLSLTDDGRVFFNSSDALAPRDLDSRQDAYEWADATPQLISTGSSPFASSLLGASADGRDADFFTRDALVPQDQNGSLVRVYDARTGGGFPFVPAPVLCKASDECHGPGSQDPGSLNINTRTGTVISKTPIRCKRGTVKRHGRCVRRHHHRKQSRANQKRQTQRANNTDRGGAK